LGKRLVYTQDFPNNSADLQTILAKLKASGAAAAYFNSMSEDTLANLVNQTRRLGISAQNTYLKCRKLPLLEKPWALTARV
jgi:ABC-type branched-subunit amino acid transport system substrate-binding protein